MIITSAVGLSIGQKATITAQSHAKLAKLTPGAIVSDKSQDREAANYGTHVFTIYPSFIIYVI